VSRLGSWRAAPRVSSSYTEEAGMVVYYLVVAWDAVNAKRGIVQPLCDESTATWAAGVLSAHYPDRTYETVKRYAKKGVTIEQMEAFGAPVMEDLNMLKLADQLGLDWYN